MEFLQDEALSNHVEKISNVLETVQQHLLTLKSAEPENLSDNSDATLNTIGEENVYALRNVVDEQLKNSDLSDEERLRMLGHKTNSILAGENITEARKCAQGAFDLAKSIGMKCYVWSTSLDLTLIARYQGRLSDAEKFLEIARDNATTLTEEHKTLVVAGELLLAKGQLNDAIKNVFEPLLDNVEDAQTKGLLLQKLGNACRSAAKWGLAKEYLKKSIEIAKDIKNKVEEFDRHGDLGNVYRSEGRISDALHHQWLHLKFALNRGDMMGLIVSCFNIGMAYYTIKPKPNLDSAMIFTVMNNIFATRTHYEPLRGISLNNLAKIYLAMELYEAAVPVFQDCAAVAKNTGNIAGEGMAYGNLGTAHRALQNYEEAIKYHEIYKKSARERGDDGGMSIMQRELALDHILKEDFVNAEKEIFDSISTNEAIRSELGAEDLSKLANFDKNQADSFNLLILVLTKQGKHKQALAYSELAKARALSDRICQVQGDGLQRSKWIWKEDILEQQMHDENMVDEIIQDYLQMATNSNITFLHYSIITELDSSSNRQKWMYIWVVTPKHSDGSDKQIHFQKLKISDSTHKTELNLNETFFSNMTHSFENGNCTNLQENKVTANKSTDDDEEPSSSLINSSYNLKTSANVIIKELENMDLSQAPEKLEQFDETDDVILKLRQMNVDIGELSTNTKTPEDWGNEGTKQLRILYEICIAPVKHVLDENFKTNSVSKLIVMPQEFLFNVPFCALQSSNGRYLIEDYIVSYTPSLRALLLLQISQSELCKKQIGNLKVLSVGNPTTQIKEVQQIQYSEEEARIVENIFVEHDCVVLTKEKAKKDEVMRLMKEVDVLHIASYAFPTDLFQKEQEGDYMMRGCILLAQSSESCTGVLHAHEIQKEWNRLQLVMLSCCKAGLGKVTGDGVVGLYRSFLASGTAAIVLTMWKIKDDVSPMIMKKFYEEYVSTRDASAALRSAMLHAYHENKLPPNQWAAFSLMGSCT